jgi:hypothetical protein
MAHLGRTADQKIAEIAGGQHGVATRAALLRAGITLDEIRHRLNTGALIREYKGVYRVGHRAPSVLASYMAAVRACGDGAMLAGRAAAYLLRIVKAGPPPPEVIAPTQRRIEGIATRRSRFIDPRDRTTVRRIPVTTVPRTLVDVAAVLEVEGLARACHEAGVRYRTTPRHVAAALGRYPNAPGAKKLRQIVHGDAPVLLSKLEEEFFSRLREARLPLPLTNRPAGGRRVDCRWPDDQVTVELVSYTFHNSRHSWELDHQRRREARARGDRFRTYTWADVVENPGPMLAELRELLFR